MSPDMKYLLEQMYLSRFTVARGIDDRPTNFKNMKLSLKKRVSKCSAFSIALDESTDLSDTAQLVDFIQRIKDNFEVIEGILDMANMESTTAGQNICEVVIKLMKKFGIGWHHYE